MRLAFEKALLKLGVPQTAIDAATGGFVMEATWKVTRPTT